jgi:hypothetical protein
MQQEKSDATHKLSSSPGLPKMNAERGSGGADRLFFQAIN